MYYLRTWVKDKVKNGDQPSKPKSYKKPDTWSNRIPTSNIHKKKPVTQTKGAKRQPCVLIPIYIKTWDFINSKTMIKSTTMKEHIEFKIQSLFICIKDSDPILKANISSINSMRHLLR